MSQSPIDTDMLDVCAYEIERFCELALIMEQMIEEVRWYQQAQEYDSAIIDEKGLSLHRCAAKAASHQNLAMALELMFKLMIAGGKPNSVPEKSRNHGFKRQYDQLSTDHKQMLNTLFSRHLQQVHFETYAKGTTPPPDPKSIDTKQKKFTGFEELLLYLDNHVRLYDKRYLWERLREGQGWELFLADIKPFVEVIRSVLDDYVQERLKT